MKFKVGEKVRVIRNINRRHIGKHYFNINEEVNIKEYDISDNSYLCSDLENFNCNCYVCEEDLESITKNTQEIHIMIKDMTTNAIMKENGNIVKCAKAKLNPNDEFNFEYGVNLCMDRLFNRKSKPINIETTYKEVKRKAKLGEYVKITESDSIIPETNGVPDYKVGDVLEIKSVDYDECVSYVNKNKIEYADKETRRILNENEYVVLEPKLDLSLVSIDDLLQEIHKRVIK